MSHLPTPTCFYKGIGFFNMYFVFISDWVWYLIWWHLQRVYFERSHSDTRVRMDHISWADAINSGQGVVLGKWRSCPRHFANSFLNVIFVFQAQDGSARLWFGLGLSSPSLSARLITFLSFLSPWTTAILGSSPVCSNSGCLTQCPLVAFLLSLHLFVYLTSLVSASASCPSPGGASLILWVASPPCSSSPCPLLLYGYHRKWCWTCSLTISPMTHKLRMAEPWTFRPPGTYRAHKSSKINDRLLFSTVNY